MVARVIAVIGLLLPCGLAVGAEPAPPTRISIMGVKEMELSRAVSERVELEIKAAKAQQEYEATSAAVQKGESNRLIDTIAYKHSPFLMNEEFDAAKADAVYQARVEMLAQAKERFETLQSEYDMAIKRTENLKADVGELANVQLKLSRMIDEEKGLGDELVKLKLQIENVLAEQALQKGK